MKLLLIGVILLSVFVIPAAFAETPYIFVQIIHRDSDGNLLAYLQSDRVSDANFIAINEMLDYESTRRDDPTYQINGNIFQVITRENTLHFDSSLMYASTDLASSENDVILRLPHDGLRVLPDDSIKVIWIFSRSV
jgi:hypothetical protein